ncbi:MAG: hypothetical protein D6806_09020 [Deltaproteobacteria bacterium]|nr:MAG: hypothetical protein D6806_09020 [Deltaproteobacteria bacterium]
MPGLGVVNNPYSRKNRKNPFGIETLGFIVGTSGESVATQSTDDIDRLLRSFKDQQIEVLAINGGDGSNTLVLSKLVKIYGDQPLPKIALLRGGTMNIAANSCGIRGTPAGIMMNLTRKIRDGIPFQTTWRDLLCVEEHYGFIFGCGFVHTFLEEFYGRRKKSPVQAARMVGRLVGSAMIRGPTYKRLTAPVDCSITVDGQKWPHERYYAVAASTVEQIGLGFRAFRLCELKPHAFHMLGLVRPVSSLIPSIPKLYFGRKVAEKKLHEQVGSLAVLEAEKPIAYTIDGEIYTGAERLEITCGPRVEIVID